MIREPDPATRRQLLEFAWTEDGELVEPRGRFQGREAIIDRIDGFQDRLPGGRVDITTGIDEHHGFVRYGWKLRDKDGTVVLEGIDACELADDGRLRRVVMFFGPLPEPEGLVGS